MASGGSGAPEVDFPMSCEFAISVSQLGKCYQIFDRPQDRLKAALIPRIQRWVGREQTEYGRPFWALRDVSFDIRRGESVGIIGKNGSGKSTLLQIICGTLQPTRGALRTQGRIAALLELGAGFNPEFTGRENVYLNGALYGLSRADVEARFDGIAAFADIGRFLDQPVKTYSSGMFVRLAFAVIAHLDAEILVVDEALAVGDAYFTQKCMRFLRSFMERGTVLFVSHDMASVKTLAERSLWLEGGQLKGEGGTRRIADAYLKALYSSEQRTDRPNAPRVTNTGIGEEKALDARDCRLPDLEALGVRNAVQVFRFDPADEGFGDGGATIVGATLRSRDGAPAHAVYGGERVRLEIRVEAHRRLEAPIVGFFLRNRLGQNVFGDNTYVACLASPVACDQSTELIAHFDFVMPFLPRGDYSFSAAIASGSNHDHVQHHWIHDAFMIKSLASDVHADLFGVPMAGISLHVQAPENGRCA